MNFTIKKKKSIKGSGKSRHVIHLLRYRTLFLYKHLTALPWCHHHASVSVTTTFLSPHVQLHPSLQNLDTDNLLAGVFSSSLHSILFDSRLLSSTFHNCDTQCPEDPFNFSPYTHFECFQSCFVILSLENNFLLNLHHPARCKLGYSIS